MTDQQTLRQDLRVLSDRVHARHSSALARTGEIEKILDAYGKVNKTDKLGQDLQMLRFHLKGDVARLWALAKDMKSVVERLEDDLPPQQEGPRHVMTKEDSRLFSKAMDTPPTSQALRAAEAYHQRVASAD